MTARLVLLASGSGTLAQAVLDACGDGTLAARVVAVVSDRADCGALTRAREAGVPAHSVVPADHATRADWDAALRDELAALQPDWVVSAGFMRILGAPVVDTFSGRLLNTHPALLPAFPGAHGVRDALAYGVKVTGCTVHLVDHGVDTGPILAQRAVEVCDGDDEDSLHERIKAVERTLLVQTLSHLIGENP